MPRHPVTLAYLLPSDSDRGRSIRGFCPKRTPNQWGSFVHRSILHSWKKWICFVFRISHVESCVISEGLSTPSPQQIDCISLQTMASMNSRTPPLPPSQSRQKWSHLHAGDMFKKGQSKMNQNAIHQFPSALT